MKSRVCGFGTALLRTKSVPRSWTKKGLRMPALVSKSRLLQLAYAILLPRAEEPRNFRPWPLAVQTIRTISNRICLMPLPDSRCCERHKIKSGPSIGQIVTSISSTQI